MNDTARSRTVALVVLVAVSVAVYGRGLTAGFVGDDFMILHRLRALASPLDVLRFFRGDFFEYYRPLPFLSQALDWWIGGYDPLPYHLTNLLIHIVNAVLVMMIGIRLSPRSLAGPLAGLLFALHASNHEAVMWISARFDLLATCFSLAAIVWLLRDGKTAEILAPIFFLAAVLSKESAVAMPIAAAGVAVFLRRESTRGVVRIAGPWVAALVAYALLRRIAGGVSAVGGAARLPKALALATCLGLLLAAAAGRWDRVRRWVVRRGPIAGIAIVLLIALTGLAASAVPNGIAAEKLAVAGFAIFHLASPVVDLRGVPFYLNPGTTWYWLGGAIALAAAAAVLFALWRTVLGDDRMWFLATLLAGALLPISALTEGTRYLYLPSAACALVAGILVAESRRRVRTAASLAVTVFIAISCAQIWTKVGDWVWAGRLTAQGARLVDASLAPSCGTGDVVFLTEPVGIRGVYTHFLYETFEPPHGCMPASFQILMRIVRLDAHVDVRWDGPSRLLLTIPEYQDNVVLSRDLRNFDRPVRGSAPVDIGTAIGTVRAVREDSGERFTLSLAPGVKGERVFYYSDGAMRAVAR